MSSKRCIYVYVLLKKYLSSVRNFVISKSKNNNIQNNNIPVFKFHIFKYMLVSIFRPFSFINTLCFYFIIHENLLGNLDVLDIVRQQSSSLW